jgi:hypothetical protein
MAESSKSGDLKIRMDFVIEASQMINEETGEFKCLLVPDPAVWEKTTINQGTEGYLNKIDNTFVSVDALKSLAEQIVGMPIKYEPPAFQGKEEYLQRSKKRLSEDED